MIIVYRNSGILNFGVQSTVFGLTTAIDFSFSQEEQVIRCFEVPVTVMLLSVVLSWPFDVAGDLSGAWPFDSSFAVF